MPAFTPTSVTPVTNYYWYFGYDTTANRYNQYSGLITVTMLSHDGTIIHTFQLDYNTYYDEDTDNSLPTNQVEIPVSPDMVSTVECKFESGTTYLFNQFTSDDDDPSIIFLGFTDEEPCNYGWVIWPVYSNTDGSR